MAPLASMPVIMPPALTAELLGVRIQPNNRAALFHSGQEANARWMAEGEVVDGWMIHAIDEDGVLLRFADKPYELRLWPE